MKEAITMLLNREPYIACLVQRCRHIYTDKVPTAAVRVMPNGIIELLVNPEFFYNQTVEERIGLIQHEMYHLICNHLERHHGLNMEKANIAMDEAINQYIPRQFLPKRAILPEYFNHEKKKAFEYYYNLHMLRDDSAKYQQPQKYKGGVDDQRNKEELKKQIQDSLKKQQEIMDKQEQLQEKQEQKSSKNSDENKNNSEVKKDESALSREQDSQEHSQQTMSEEMIGNGLQKESEQSDEIADRQKNLRKQMEKLQEKYPEKGSDEISADQKEMQKLQEDMKNNQEQMQKALDQLSEINQQAQKREQEKKEKGEGQPQPGSGGQGDPSDGEAPHVIDTHDLWNSSPASKEEQKRTLANALSQAMQDTERQWGKDRIPEHIKQLIEEALKKPKVNWKALIRSYLGKCLVNDQTYSRKKPSRKFGYIAPGKVQKFGPKIIVAVDCSGSVTNPQYSEFMSEFKGITAHLREKIEVIFFDYEMSDYKMMIDENTKNLPTRPASGGTNFQCVINYANEQRPDLLVILTDGDAPCPTKPKYPVLWGLVGGRTNPQLTFGKQVLLELNNGQQNSKTYEAGA